MRPRHSCGAPQQSSTGLAERPPRMPPQRRRTSPQARPGARPLRLALLAESHLVQVGLTTIVKACAGVAPLDIGVLSSHGDPVLRAVWAGQAELVLCAPDALAEAERITAVAGAPLLVYATAEAAPAVCARPLSVVIGPTSPDELVEALAVVRAGGRYRNPAAEALVGLDPRQRAILRALLRGATTAEIAAAVGLSSHRLRHLVAALYDQLGLVHSRVALVAWAREAPLQLITPPDDCSPA